MKRIIFIVLILSLILFAGCGPKAAPPATENIAEDAITVEVSAPTLEEETLTTEIQDTEEPDFGNAI